MMKFRFLLWLLTFCTAQLAAQQIICFNIDFDSVQLKEFLGGFCRWKRIFFILPFVLKKGLYFLQIYENIVNLQKI